jgi:FkbM family methyltransferase
MAENVKGDFNLMNSIMQWTARKFGYVIVLEKIHELPDAGYEGSKIDYLYLDHLSDLLEEFSKFTPRNFFEVGANFAQDAAYLARKWALEPGAVFIFEPHPEIAARVSSHYDFRVFPIAISNVNGWLTLNAVKLDESSNSGVSSLLQHTVNSSTTSNEITVQVNRLDEIISSESIQSIDFLKIDVEGLSYEVLEGLGDSISKVACIQVETEYIPIWEGQRMQADVYGLLEAKGFQLIEHELQMDGVQADSLWIRRELVQHKVYDIARQQWIMES